MLQKSTFGSLPKTFLLLMIGFVFCPLSLDSAWLSDDYLAWTRGRKQSAEKKHVDGLWPRVENCEYEWLQAVHFAEICLSDKLEHT